MADEGLHAVGRLIEAEGIRQGRFGKNLPDASMASRARKRGHKISTSNFSRIKTQPVKSVSPKQIQLLTDALQIPTNTVIEAYLETMGFPFQMALVMSVRDAIRADESLTPEDQEVLVELHRILKKRAAAAQDSSGTVPKSEAGDKPSPRRTGRSAIVLPDRSSESKTTLGEQSDDIEKED